MCARGRLQAITELLFFASVGDVSRCKKICKTWRIQVCPSSDNMHMLALHQWRMATAVAVFID
jgi:hypothetical protein